MLAKQIFMFLMFAALSCTPMTLHSQSRALIIDIIVRSVFVQAVSNGTNLAIPSSRSDVASLFQAEGKRGAVLSYNQVYKVHHRNVEYHGTIFGVISDVQINGCELRIRSMVIDRYSGYIGSKPVGQTQTTFVTSTNFKLTSKMASDLKVVNARPVRQLGEGTNAVCSEAGECNLTWLEVRTDTPQIYRVDTTDDFDDYDGAVKVFDGVADKVYFPLSSAAVGNELIASLRGFAQSCAR